MLENVYFPNNDKLNKDGIAAINMRVMGNMSLPRFLMQWTLETTHYRDVKRNLEMLKSLASYGMDFQFEYMMQFPENFISDMLVFRDFTLSDYGRAR